MDEVAVDRALLPWVSTTRVRFGIPNPLTSFCSHKTQSQFRRRSRGLPGNPTILAVAFNSLPTVINKALASCVRTFWIICPPSHLVTLQALVPSLGQNVTSATIRHGMNIPTHFRKLVNLCRLRKKAVFFGLCRLLATVRLALVSSFAQAAKSCCVVAS